MKLSEGSVTVMCLALLVSFKVQSVDAQEDAQESEVIKLQQTIRGNQEQPKVLTIVPWQSPKPKEALPSQIIERINKKFVPLQRDELTRKIQILNNKSIPQAKG